MRDVPIYVEATSDEPPDAYFRKGVVSTPLRLVMETPSAQLDPRVASAIEAVSRVSTCLPAAGVLATISRVGNAVEAVRRAAIGAVVAPGIVPDAPATEGLEQALASLATVAATATVYAEVDDVEVRLAIAVGAAMAERNAAASDYFFAESFDPGIPREQAEARYNIAARKLALRQEAFDSYRSRAAKIEEVKP